MRKFALNLDVFSNFVLCAARFAICDDTKISANVKMRVTANTVWYTLVVLWVMAVLGLVGAMAGAVWGMRHTLNAVVENN